MSITTNQQRIIEVIAVICTALGKFFFMDYLNWRFPFVVTAILAWTVYIIYQSRKRPGILAHWGFRKDNFKEVLLKVLPFGVFALIAFIGIGYYRDTLNPTWHILPILLTYPIWGVIQQFLLIGLMTGNLQEVSNGRVNKNIIIIVSAIVFALVHYPFYWLMGGTFILAILYGYIYLKARNLYVLGLFHGWLAALFYYTVVNQDPFLNTFGKLLQLE